MYYVHLYTVYIQKQIKNPQGTKGNLWLNSLSRGTTDTIPDTISTDVAATKLDGSGVCSIPYKIHNVQYVYTILYNNIIDLQFHVKHDQFPLRLVSFVGENL